MQGETKEDVPLTNSVKKARYAYISQKILLQFQPSVDPDDIPYEQIAWWKIIFSYIQPNDYERLHLRRLCNMFKASLKAPPKGMFTVYPHPNHASVDSLINRLNALHSVVPHLAATVVFIQEGEHEIDGYQREPDEDDGDDYDDNDLHESLLVIKYAMKIIGAGRDKTFLRGGGLIVKGMEEEGRKRVELKDMTVTNGDGNGLTVMDGPHCFVGSFTLSFLCDSVTFTQCECHGVMASDIKGRLINCVITQCGCSGIFCGSNALIEMEGSQTKVDGNVTRGVGNYGLATMNESSIIHLLSPLSKESVSTNNPNNRNGQNYGVVHWGNGGTIQTVDTFETL